ncbi:(+)-cis,trans-nepetalactol synthase NEPS1-like [Rosa chinensis]|uniref:(+)-cis,trans-nepetalactol synthase NEPS1-like n=1 Tax=Rosa chinensis TaxID=74649 RepID=UPI000D093B74|nr:(+)-cis,trans-nepetalactol synthase NEPS1-like [Rosa chinensis]
MTEAIPVPVQKLHGKVAIVTGAASGIGAVTARHIANHGALAVVIADLQDAKGREVAASIGSNRCTYVHCDVASEDQVKYLVDSTVKLYGRLDVMYSNAGIYSPSVQTVLELDLSSFDKVMAVNARGMAACVKHAARAMVEKGVKGSIVCTASFVAECGTEGVTDYTMSKHAVLGLMRSASVQLVKHGVRVNCLSPGLVATPMFITGYNLGEEELSKTMAAVYTGSQYGPVKEKDLADAVVFLASEDSALITGQNLIVDGGFGAQAVSVLGQNGDSIGMK